MVELSGLEPNQHLYVGDREEADIVPAKKVGLKTVLVWNVEPDTQADFSFDHVSNIISLFL
jgi:FMN phosphatase YigB (HAD superfamily)